MRRLCGGSWSSWACSVDDVEVMECGIQRLDPRHGDTSFLCNLERGPEIRLDLHRALGLKVHPHGAVVVLWTGHLLKRCLAEIVGECAVGSICKRDHLIEHSGDESTHADLVHEFSVVGCLEYDTGRVESDWTVER